MPIFTGVLTGTPARAGHDSDLLHLNPVAAYLNAATQDRDAWARPEALPGTITIGLASSAPTVLPYIGRTVPSQQPADPVMAC
jgi:hypothetical protein